MSSRSTPPLVSIALCTYNGGRYVAEQLHSLSAQTHGVLEIVAVDDSSTDNTVELLHAHALRDSRLRVHTNPTNLGFRGNFEKALSLCTGAFIAPCDQDDIWSPEKISVLLSALGRCEMAYCDSELIDGAGRPLGRHIFDLRRLGPVDTAIPFAFGNAVSGHAMLFRRSLVAKALPIPIEFFHDWWLASVAAAHGGIAYVDQCLVQYRQHSNTVTDILSSRQRDGANSRGRRLRRSREQANRLLALAALPGRGQPLLQRLARLWQEREARWFTPQLFLVALRNLRSLRQFDRKPTSALVLDSCKLLWGLRLKALVNQRAYAATFQRK